jgi:ankyrin repeat protein
MLSTKFCFSSLFLATWILMLPGKLMAQVEGGVIAESIDTTDYLPSYYDDYQDYNLMIAASKGYDSEIKRWLSKGADINAETAEGATPLIFAVANNHLTSVKLLLENGPNLDHRTSASETALLIAVKNNNLEIAEALIRAGADIDLADRFGAGPLHYASIRGEFNLTDMLLYYDANRDKKALDGTTPLMAAVWAGWADISDLLIQNGANMEARDNNGYTPFLISAQNGDTLIMDLLLKEGVDLYEKNDLNYNALDLAIEANKKTAVKFLLNKGKDWVSGEKQSLNPYKVATSFGRKELFNLLESNKLPGKPKPGIEEFTVNINTKLNNHDIFTGLKFSATEPLFGAGVIGGFDTKLWYTRVLLKSGENLYYQYFDKSSVIYGGIFKNFVLRESMTGSRLSLSTTLMAAYQFGNKLKGTSLIPENKFQVIPSAGLIIQKGNYRLTADLEYMKSVFYRAGPLWLRAGIGYNFYLGKIRSAAKVIKWY